MNLSSALINFEILKFENGFVAVVRKLLMALCIKESYVAGK